MEKMRNSKNVVSSTLQIFLHILPLLALCYVLFHIICLQYIESKINIIHYIPHTQIIIIRNFCNLVRIFLNAPDFLKLLLSEKSVACLCVCLCVWPQAIKIIHMKCSLNNHTNKSYCLSVCIYGTCY